MNVTVYSTPGCTQCNATYRALKKKGVDHNVIDVTQDADAHAVTQELGYSKAPVVVIRTNDEIVKHWSGFNPENIEELALERAGIAA